MPAWSETCVWFLRHGESTFNVEHRCQGSCDEPELTPRGREGALLSGKRLAAEEIQVVISSPLQRASETAEEVRKEVRKQRGGADAFETDGRLREIELYSWEGLPLEEIPRRFPQQYWNWRLGPHEFQVHSKDNQVQYPVRNLYERARSFWNDLLATYAGKSVLLVTHAGTIRALVTQALGVGAAHFQSFQQSNCGLSRLRFPPGSGRTKLDLLNDTGHLGENLPKLKEGRRGMRILFLPVTEASPVALRGLTVALDRVVIEHVFVIGGNARDVASQLFPSLCQSCLVVPDARADSVADKLLHDCFSDELRQVAILAPPPILRRVLQRQLCLSDRAANSLDLRPFEITSVHHPGNGVPPILQSLNMSKPSPALIGV